MSLNKSEGIKALELISWLASKVEDHGNINIALDWGEDIPNVTRALILSDTDTEEPIVVLQPDSSIYNLGVEVREGHKPDAATQTGMYDLMEG